MKKHLLIAILLLVGSMSFAQKDELKTAEKAIKSGNFGDAKSAIKSAEALIGNADDKTKAKFYFLKGQALYAKGTGTDDDVNTAIESFDSLKELETSMGKLKYTTQATEIQTEMLNNFLTKANASLQSKNYKLASTRFEKAYKMSPKDTVYLYYAASTAVNAQDYEASLDYYLELNDLGFTGQYIRYLATNKETGEEENFESKTIRDAAIKSGSYISPKQEKSKSKYSEIIKNIALIYVANEENEKAVAAMKEARDANPDDLSLLISEANVHLKMGNRERFKELIEEATLKDPENAELQYNLGALAGESGDNEAARTYYAKALKLKPNYIDAQINMAALILDSEQAIIEEMNSLGTSATDNKRYDELRDRKDEIYREAIPYLESALKNRPKKIELAKSLMNIYSVLGETAKFKDMKAKVETMKTQEN